MDYLMFCTGECDDAMRDRDFYLVKNRSSATSARAALAAHFLCEGYSEEYASDRAEDYSVFIKGVGLEDAMAGKENYSYRLHVL